MLRSRLDSVRAVLSILSLISPVLTVFAQSETSGEEEIYVMSPFSVDASQDIGYVANRDVSGSRLNTALRDVPAPITVFTREMLNDLNALNVQQVLDYAPNVEYTENTTGFQDLSLINMRIRGIANSGAGATQDFFDVYDDLDTYKIDRIGFSRGPNGVLFGIGTPDGKITSTPKTALLGKDGYELESRFDSWGSWRAVFDANKVLINERLALRAVLLGQDQRDAIEEQFRKDERIYLAGKWVISDRAEWRTTLRTNFERIDGEDATGNGILPFERVAFWQAADSPTGRLMLDGSGDPIPESIPEGTANQSSGNKLVLINGEHNLPIMNWKNTLTATGTGGATLSEAIYPYDINIKGTQALSPREITQYSAFLEQQLGANTFVEAAYFHGEAERRWAIKTGGMTISADPNTHLPNGDPNPNVGKLYVESDGLSDDRFDDHDTYRISGSHRLDFNELTPNLGKWLGWHQIFGLWERTESDSRLERMQAVNTTPLPGYPLEFNNAQNRVYRRSYLDFENGITTFRSGDPRAITSRDGVRIEMLPVQGQTASVGETESIILAIQNHFWEDRIITTFGWREDSRKEYGGSPVRDANGVFTRARDLDVDLLRDYTLHPTSMGVVVRPIDSLSFSYNKSENFAGPPSGFRNLFNELLPSVGGEGEDYGVRVDILKDKLTATLNFYESGRVNAISGQTIADDLNDIWEALGRDELILPSDPQVRDINDETAEGWEFTLYYNPTPNWRIFGSLTNNSTEISNVRPNWKRYYALHRDEWAANADVALANQPPETDTVGELVDDIVDRENAVIVGEGATAYNLREWNASLATNYKFSEGLFEGFSVGGSLLYRGDAVSGYRVVVVNGVSTRGEPFNESGYTTVNLNLGYEFQLSRKVDAKIKFTLNNIFDSDGRVIVTSRTTTETSGVPVGTPTRARWLPGTSAVLTAGIEF